MPQKTVLVTGGAGYIGSHVVKELVKKNYNVVIVDSLENGHKAAVIGGELVTCDVRQKNQLEQVFIDYPIETVIHFAAYASVPDSVGNPAKYFENNLVGGLNLLACMRQSGVNTIVFSSSAAVYGEPEQSPIKESAAKNPTNPYGLTKWQFEQILGAYDKAYGMKSVSLRYFCAAGADPDGEIGENHDPETHVIPVAILTALGQRDEFKIFGTDYPTTDGTGVRDFIHVTDLAQIHILALEYLLSGGITQQYNCGNARGYSVREIIGTVEKIAGRKIKVKEEARRPGDPAILIADSSRIKDNLGFIPRYSDLETIVKTSWDWHKNHLGGFGIE